MQVTRRELARALGVAAMAPAISARAQAQPAGSSEETQSAHELMRANADAIAKVKLPMAIEPPFHFKA